MNTSQKGLMRKTIAKCNNIIAIGKCVNRKTPKLNVADAKSSKVQYY